MRLIRGPRPWPIRLSACLLLAAALLHLAQRLSDPSLYGLVWQQSLPLEWPVEDIGIIGASALFTIALIPLALVWFRASRIARILVGAMAVFRLSYLPDYIASWPHILPVDLFLLLVPVAALAVMCTPAANRWFALQGRQESDAYA